MSIFLIAATCGPNFGIGLNNSLPWGSNKEDMSFFRERTLNNVVIMGRKTFESIGKPLANRTNIVISKTKVDHPKVHTVDNTHLALYLAKTFNRPIYVIGGQSIYEQFMPVADYILRTEIPDNGYKNFDTYFPPIESNVWDMLKIKDLGNDTKVYFYGRRELCNALADQGLNR